MTELDVGQHPAARLCSAGFELEPADRGVVNASDMGEAIMKNTGKHIAKRRPCEYLRNDGIGVKTTGRPAPRPIEHERWFGNLVCQPPKTPKLPPGYPMSIRVHD